MNKIPAILVGVVFILLSSHGMAQTEEPDYRAEFPKADAIWTVIFTKDTKDAAKKTPQLKQIDVVRKGDLRRDILIWTDGAKSEHWWSKAGNEVFFENRGDSEVRAIKASQKSEARYDETFFLWVGKKTYVEERDLDGKKFWYFETQSRNEEMEETTTFSAWVDPKTALPYSWSDGRRTVYFEFKPFDPALRFEVPPQFAEAIERYNAYRTPPVRVKRR